MNANAARLLLSLALILGAAPALADNGLLARFGVLLGKQSAAMPEVDFADAKLVLMGFPDFHQEALEGKFGLTSLHMLQVGSVQLPGRFGHWHEVDRQAIPKVVGNGGGGTIAAPAVQAFTGERRHQLEASKPTSSGFGLAALE